MVFHFRRQDFFLFEVLCRPLWRGGIYCRLWAFISIMYTKYFLILRIHFLNSVWVSETFQHYTTFKEHSFLETFQLCTSFKQKPIRPIRLYLEKFLWDFYEMPSKLASVRIFSRFTFRSNIYNHLKRKLSCEGGW